ncbi:MAG: outer membrane lipoprotein-sorting protein [Bacteroidota bacterium]
MNRILTALLVIVFSNVSFAQDAAQKGMEIAKAAEAADEGFGSNTAELKMILRNKNGQTSERFLFSKTLELTEDGDKSMIVFNSPKDVKGTATLTFTHKEGSDDQWLFLPSIKRVKRISSNNKSGPFMGSEFAYEDLSSQEVEKYSYKFVEMNGDLAVVEQDPVDPKSGYTRRIVTYNTAQGYRIEKVDFYDRKNALLKTLVYKGYKQYKGKHWRPETMVMTNHQSNKETELIFTNYNFEINLSDKDFTQSALKRAS